MKKYIKIIFKPFFGWRVFQGFFRALYLLGLKGMNYGGGANWGESGEAKALRDYITQSTQRSSSFILFDVGANVGDYALATSALLGSKRTLYKIFCFEPAQDTFLKLKENTKNVPSITCVNIALGPSVRQSKLYSLVGESGLASVYNRHVFSHESHELTSEAVQVKSLDIFCFEQKIDRINFLKLDVEGYEYEVLLGATDLLKRNVIQCIQFEFGGTDVDARVFFRDFYNLLSPTYNLYRILQHGLVELFSYDESQEIFLTTNYLAILKKV
jgi:FkbM family methyltransferase